MTILQLHVMKAASSAVHLTSIHGSWGFQPLFRAIPVLYALLMPLSGSWTSRPGSSLIPESGVGCMHACVLSLIPSPIPLMQTAAIVTDILHSVFQLSMGSCDPVRLSLISSSSAELYFLS